MKKVVVMPVQQHDSEFYIGKYDPRKLVQMADQDILSGALQEAQRPLMQKRLEEIAGYTGPREKGVLPASVLIGTRDRSKLKLEVEEDNWGGTRYYIQFPDTPEELEEYEDTIDIIDGQHRLFAFCEQMRNEELTDDMTYEIPFSLFEMPNLRSRQRLFTVTNEKQKAVNGNLLLYLKSQLNMLNSVEERYLPLVQLLNAENRSPLKNRIIMSAEPIHKGYKAKELIKIMDKAKFGDVMDWLAGTDLDAMEQMLKAISIYLSGWEARYGLSFQDPGKETMTKISGLRYILLLFTTFFDHAMNSQSQFKETFVVSVIKDLERAKGLAAGETLFDRSLEFRGEGATIKMAQDDAVLLKAYLADKMTNGFNPLA